MAVDQDWKKRVDEVFAGGDLSGLFKAAGSPFGLSREESIGRQDYLVGRLYPHSSNFERLARETDPGDLTPLENVNRLDILSEVSNARVEELHTVAATSSPQLAATELIRLEAEERRAFGGKTAFEAATEAGRQLQGQQQLSQAGSAALTGLGSMPPSQRPLEPGQAERAAQSPQDRSRTASTTGRTTPDGPPRTR